jgi:peptidyl-prolyl cis-trans isomerase C
MTRIKRLLREPLFHFAVLGAALFGLNFVLGDRSADTQPRIEVTAGDIERLRTIWERQRQRPPTEAELRGLIETQLREEVLYREALAMGLDKNDAVVRRTLAQKVEFLTEDLLAAAEPSTADLERYFEQNAESYRVPGRLSFVQIYFSPDRHGAQTEALAREVLDVLSANPRAAAEAGEGLGDPIMLEYAYADASTYDIESIFGRGFAAAIAELAPGQWQGPIESGFGLHLVYIESHTPSRIPSIADVLPAVLRDYEQVRRDEMAQAFYARLRQRYRIVIDEAAITGATISVNVTEPAQ